jgi:hypothetical protein
MNDLFDLLWENSYEINTSMWATLSARLVLPSIKKRRAKSFPPSMKKGKLNYYGMELEIDAPDRIVAHLTRECGGNVHDCHVVDVTSGSFEKETHGANPHSGAYDNHPYNVAKNAADLEADSVFGSAFRDRWEDIPQTKNNWVCYDFKERRIVPTHYTIRQDWDDPGIIARTDPGFVILPKSWEVELDLGRTVRCDPVQ